MKPTILMFLLVLNTALFAQSLSYDSFFESDFIWVEGGSFVMGADDRSAEEKPAHKVYVDSFYISQFELTQAQWRFVMGYNPSGFQGCDDCPVEQVSWNDIQRFLDKLNKNTKHTYRLPTEAEWEFAARGGNKGSHPFKYAGSNDANEVAWYTDNSEGTTHPVGQKLPNALGLYDMSGNVREWCSDWYGGDYYSFSPEINPKGPVSGVYRVLKGGSWDYSANHSRVTIRNRYGPDSRHNRHGFRLVFD